MEPIKKEQIETPALLVDLDILESNIKTMADFLKEKKAKLRPHYKSYKCPTISHKQIAAGAKGITCSKVGEAETLVNAGIKDVYSRTSGRKRTTFNLIKACVDALKKTNPKHRSVYPKALN